VKTRLRPKTSVQWPRSIETREQMEGGPGVKPGFAASDAAVLFSYTTHPLELAPGIQPGSLR
jgi:hypothetical protein